MRILSIGNFTRGWDGSICDEEHVASSLEQLGHTVERWQREKIEEPYQDGPYDFILLAQWYGYRSDFIDELRSNYSGVPIIYWAFDYQQQSNEPWHRKLAEECDLFLSKEAQWRDRYGDNFRWFSQDFGPNFLDQHPEPVEQDIDVLFTGSCVPWGHRNEFIRAVNERYGLVTHGVTSGQWSNLGVEKSYGPVMDEDLPALYARAKIVLSVDHVYSAGYWSDRNFQAMLTGAFVLFKHVPMSESVFSSGVAYFYEVEDCIEKIRHYLDNPDERNQIAQVGYQLAHARGKAVHRAHELLTLIRSEIK